MPVMSCPNIISITMLEEMPTIKLTIATIWIPNDKMKANLRPCMSARAGKPSMPISAPNANIACMLILLILPLL